MDDKSERGRGGRFEAKRRIADTHTQIKMEEEEEGEMNCNGGRAEEQVNGGIGGGGGKERERGGAKRVGSHFLEFDMAIKAAEGGVS